jgi:hypothetical protein
MSTLNYDIVFTNELHMSFLCQTNVSSASGHHFESLSKRNALKIYRVSLYMYYVSIHGLGAEKYS